MLSSFQYAAWIVVQQDLIERVAFAGHHGGADLAEADSVSPSGSVKDQSVADPFYVKGGALEMGFGQPIPERLRTSSETSVLEYSVVHL